VRINAYIAQATGHSRRAADQLIEAGRIAVNGQPAHLGQVIQSDYTVTLDKRPITPAVKSLTIILNKPVGYVVSRDGQGSPTIYDLLPSEYQRLKPVGRLDKDSSGLLLLTDNGQLANQLTHPRYAKIKIYEVELDKALSADDRLFIEQGVMLEDGTSKLGLRQSGGPGRRWQITMSEGRNRQIRRTFAALGYAVTKLHRTAFGDYRLNRLALGEYRPL
jgi:23S rRNA pseudouridine2605 synthase